MLNLSGGFAFGSFLVFLYLAMGGCMEAAAQKMINLMISAPASIQAKQTTLNPVPGVIVIDTTPKTIVTATLSDAIGLLFADENAATVIGTKTMSLTVSGTIDQVNASLKALQVYQPKSSPDTITIQVSDDQGGLAAPAGIAVNVTPDPRKYLPALTLPEAQAISQQHYQALCVLPSCDWAGVNGPPTVTQCWWSVMPLAGTTPASDICTDPSTFTDNGAVVVIAPSGPFSAQTSVTVPGVGKVTHGLSASQQADLMTADEVADMLPVPAPSP